MIEIKSLHGTPLHTVSSDSLASLCLAKLNLQYANLHGVDLRYANLRGASLIGANLSGANLIGANLSDANLRGADMRNANLFRTNLRNANFYEALLEGAIVYENAKLFDNASIIKITNIGSRLDELRLFITDIGIYVQTGCFSGSIDEFIKAVKENHGGNIHAQAYLSAISIAKIYAEECECLQST